MKQKEQNKKVLEKRHFSATIKRASSDSRTVEGVAAIIGSRYNMGWYDEVIAEGAFTEALKNSDIRALLNHDANKLLARTSSGTLEVWVEGKELRYKFEAPNTRDGDDVLELLDRGDLKESSFAFTIERQRWESIDHGKDAPKRWEEIRHIEEFKIIYDVSPVTYPANPDTSVAKRSFDLYKGEEQTENTIPLSVLERELDFL